MAFEALEDRRTPALAQGGFEQDSMFIRPTGETVVVVEGPDNSLVYNYTTPSGGWASAQVAGPGSTFNPPAVTVRPTGEIDVVAQGPNNSLMYYWLMPGNAPGSAWSSTQIAGAGTTFTRPDVVVRSTGEADVAAEGANNTLVYYWATPGSAWSGTQIAAAGTTFSAPSLTVRSTGEADVAAEGANNTLVYYYAWPGTAWSGTQIAGANTTFSRPDVVVRSTGEADVVAVGANNSLMYYYAWPGTAWSKTKIAGANTAFWAASVYVRPTGEADVVAEGANNTLVYYWAAPGSAWSSTQIAGAGTTDVAAAVGVTPTGQAEVATCGSGALKVYTGSPGSGWSSTQIVWSEPGVNSHDTYSPVPAGVGLFNGPSSAPTPSYTDVQQGDLADCWLLASLAETAYRAPSDITNMFTYDGMVMQGGAAVALYTVRFYNSSGTANYVLVDATLPAGSHSYDQPANNVMWVALAEKAYAEANGAGLVTSNNVGINTYGALNYGWASWAMQAITGRPAADTSNFSATDLTTAWQTGSLLALLTPGLPKTATKPLVLNGVNVVDDHYYAVVGYDASTQVFTLFNPWGVTGGYYNLPNGKSVFCDGKVTGTAQQLVTLCGGLTKGGGSSKVGDEPAPPAGRAPTQTVGTEQGAAGVQPLPLTSGAAVPSNPSDAVLSAAGAQGTGELPSNRGLPLPAVVDSVDTGLPSATVAEVVWDERPRGSIVADLFTDPRTPLAYTPG